MKVDILGDIAELLEPLPTNGNNCKFKKSTAMTLIKFLACLALITSGCTHKADQSPLDRRVLKPVIPVNYIIGPSDELEILYYVNPGFSAAKYLIETEDILRIDFSYYPELNRTVKVRPDGFITLPKVGDIKVTGEEPAVLAEKISKKISTLLSHPAVTVEAVDFNIKIKNLKEAVQTVDRGQSRLVVVRPDGKISLPYLKNEIMAAARTASDLARVLEKEYNKHIRSIGITVSIFKANSYQACIIGNVNQAGCYPLQAPTPLLQFISSSGGIADGANLQQVVIINRTSDGKPEHHVVNLENTIKKNGPDIIVKQYDVVYIPRTWLSEAELTANSIWNIIPFFINATGTIYEPK